MKSGYQLLKRKGIKEELNSKLIPMTYLNLNSEFLLGEGSFNNEVYRMDGVDIDIPLTNVVYDSEEISIELSYFMHFKEIEKALLSGDNTASYYCEDKLMKFGFNNFPNGSFLYLSYEGKNEGNIYLGDFIGDLANKFKKISSSLDEFIRSLKSVANKHNLTNDSKSRLYKNWGEDFWRKKDKPNI